MGLLESLKAKVSRRAVSNFSSLIWLPFCTLLLISCSLRCQSPGKGIATQPISHSFQFFPDALQILPGDILRGSPSSWLNILANVVVGPIVQTRGQ